MMSNRQRSAFTLIELMVSIAIFTFMAGFLVSLSGQAANLWSRNQSQSQLRERARTSLEFIGNELRQAVMPLDHSSQTGPQFVVNPSTVSNTYLHRDAIFWQAPIATSTTKGKLAAVGYFIRKDGNTFHLCRYFVNPDDANYALHQTPAEWVSDTLLDTVAPANKLLNYKGLFLQNVPGLWIKAYDESGGLYTASPDSRKDHKLPARIDLSLVFLDDSGAARLVSGALELPPASESDSAEAYLNKVPEPLRNSAGTATISVTFQDRR